MVEEKRIAQYGDEIIVRLSMTNLKVPIPDPVTESEDGIIHNIPQNARYWVDSPRHHYVFTNKVRVYPEVSTAGSV